MKHFLKGAVAAILAFGGTSTVVRADVDPFIGTVATFAQGFCPRGWTKADGRLLSISQNATLFSLLGTNYGGDGRTTFGLPNLIGRANIHTGHGPGLTSRRMGQVGGSTTTTDTEQTLANHNHAIIATISGNIVASGSAPNTSSPTNAYLGTYPGAASIYGQSSDPAVFMGQGKIAFDNTTQFAATGSGQAMENQQPFLAMMVCVALEGLYPSRN